MGLSIILSVGWDSSLLDTRRMILQAAGHIVESAHSLEEAIERFRTGDFDLVLLCHSISQPDRGRLTWSIRALGSSTPVVTVAIAHGQPPDGFADATIECAPRNLIHGVNQALLGAAKKHRLQEISSSEIPTGNK